MSSNYGSKVVVHLNLRETKKLGTPTYSVLDAKTRRVVAHTSGITLRDVTCKISKSGQLRARREGQRNVHAFIAGTWAEEGTIPEGENVMAITYNPFKNDTFVFRWNGAPALSGNYAILGFSGAYLSEGV